MTIRHAKKMQKLVFSLDICTITELKYVAQQRTEICDLTHNPSISAITELKYKCDPTHNPSVRINLKKYNFFCLDLIENLIEA
ncbi:unnamed protein product, partial [Rotaria sp. Silwood2]